MLTGIPAAAAMYVYGLSVIESPCKAAAEPSFLLELLPFGGGGAM